MMPYPFITRLSLCTILGLASCLCSKPAVAQIQIGNNSNEQVQNVFLPAPREYRQMLSRAKESMEKEQYSDAVTLLGEILTNKEIEDYFIGELGGEGTQTSIKAAAMNLLGSMPEKGREFYELQLGTEAKKKLEDALVTSDLTALTEISRMYFHTDAGYEATVILGRYKLDRGRPLAAALTLKRVADSPIARKKYDPQLSLLLASCWMYSEMPENAAKVLEDLKRLSPNTKLRIGEQEVGLFAKGDDPVAWVKKYIGQGGRFDVAGEPQWPMFRGNPQRNGHTEASAPLANFRWRVPVTNDPTDEQAAKEIAKQFKDQNAPAIPSLQPLAVNGVVVMRSPDHAWGVDFETGKRVWEYPPSGLSYEESVKESRSSSQLGLASSRSMELQQWLWGDAAYGQMSSDGRRVFLIDGLGLASSNIYNQQIIIARGGRQIRNSGMPRDSNSLVALDLEAEGKLLWHSEYDEPRLKGAFFLGAPLPLLGDLYVLAEVNSEIRLVVLDAKTGELQWMQQLAHVENRGILQDPGRRLAGASPSFADGVLICPTSAGAVVALEVSTRSLLWGYQYKQAVNQYDIRFRVPQPTNNSKDLWQDSTVTIADGKVLVTAAESDELHCLDLVTGESVWKTTKKRGDNLYVACVHDGNVVLVGKNNVTALKLSDGSSAWSGPVGISGMPSGRGYYNGKQYFLPTDKADDNFKGEVVSIDLEKGKIVSTVKTEVTLGNLICYKDEVISHGADFVYSFYQNSQLQARVDEALKANPEDPWALARKGELLVADGKIDEAIVVLRKSYKVSPEDASTRALYVSTLMELLKADFVKNLALIDELEPLISNDKQRNDFLRLVAAKQQAGGEFVAAFDTYLSLAKLLGSSQTGADEDPTLVEIESGWEIRPDHWVQARLAECYTAANADQRSEIEANVEKLLSEKNDDLKKLGGAFTFLPQGESMAIKAAQQQLAAKEIVAAELTLAKVDVGENESLAAEVKAVSTEILIATGNVRAAKALATELADKFAAVACLGKTGAEVAKELEAKLAEHAEMAVVQWPTTEVQVDRSQLSDGERSNSRQYPVRITDRSGAAAEHVEAKYDQSTNCLVVYDRYGKVLGEVSLEGNGNYRSQAAYYNLLHGKVAGHLLVVSLGFELVGIDISKLKEGNGNLWQVELYSQLNYQNAYTGNNLQLRPKSFGNPWGQTVYLASDTYGKLTGSFGAITPSGITCLVGSQLICVDPLTGKKVWVRRGMESGGDVFGNDERVYVCGPGAAEAQVFSVSDGAELERKDVGQVERRMANSGDVVLSWEQEGSNLILKATNVWTGEELWQKSSAFGAKSWLVGVDQIAVLEPATGKFSIYGLSSGKPVLETELPEEKSVRYGLVGIYVLDDADRYNLITSYSVPAPNNVRLQSAIAGLQSPLVTGRMYSFSKKTGEMMWDQPATVKHYGLPTDQPADSPFILFMRHQTPLTGDERNRTRTSVLLIDKADGRAVLEEALPNVSAHYELVASPKERKVTLDTITNRFTFEWDAEIPKPPAPPEGAGEDLASTAKIRVPGLEQVQEVNVLRPPVVIQGGIGQRIEVAAPERAVLEKQREEIKRAIERIKLQKNIEQNDVPR